jgi:hypothetical protein
MEKVNQKKEQGKWHRFLRNSCQDVLYKFKILSNITRPFTIKIVENYHQVEPCRPLFGNGCPINSHSNPMLALLRAGASFTPSPVIATNWSFACSAFIILIFVQG